eukprot:2334459-Rhodomonas_salina.5
MGCGTSQPSRHPWKLEYASRQSTRQRSLTVNYRLYHGITGHLFFLGDHDTVLLGVLICKTQQIRPVSRPSASQSRGTSAPVLARLVRGLTHVQQSRSSAAEQAPLLDPDTRKSVTGYVLSLNNAPISWKAKRQDCVTLSSTETEYVAASMAGQEVVYLWAILLGFGHEQLTPTEVWEDNAACIQIANNPVNLKFTLHIDMRLYYFQDLVKDGVTTLVKCAGTQNVADALTKSLPGPSWSLHCPFLTGTWQEYKVFFITLAITEPTAVQHAT